MIRKYLPEDVDEIIEVWRNASQIAHPFLSDEFLEQEENLMRYIYLNEAETIVFELRGKIAGFISMIGNDVGGLFVDPGNQRNGIGNALLDYVRQFYEYLTVDVFKENPIGCSFYLKYGFETVEEIVHIETGNLILRMKYPRTSVDSARG